MKHPHAWNWDRKGGSTNYVRFRKMRCAEWSLHERKMFIKFWLENLVGRNILEDLDRDRRIILKCVLKVGWEVVALMYLAQDNVQWQVLVVTVTNFWVQQKVGNFFRS
jgi:hypothetical protein